MILVTTISRKFGIKSTRGRVLGYIREHMENGDEFGYKVCDRSIGSLLGDLGVLRQDVAKSRHRPSAM